MSKKNFYITTTAPYVNADPHIGFALEIVQADVLARFNRLIGAKVAFGFGTDEHGLKIYRKALEAKKDPLQYCKEFSSRFDDLKKILNLSTTHFIRTTDVTHMKAAQELWSRCFKNGDIYKKNYKTKYCVGCELEKTDSELNESKCPVHPNLTIEIIEEENYFFRFSKYQDKLLKLYKDNPDFVVPDYRLTEIKAFVKSGLEDFSVSRLKSKMPWGVPVPNDPEHVMYVWFDALVFYISTLGWPNEKGDYSTFWPGMQVAGKDNLRQQSAIWQAMLMSAGLPNSTQIFIHGFITSSGQKMSKSLGNVVDPFELVEKYGTDAVRYYLLKEIPPAEDGDFSYRRMDEVYNSDLVNELGNLVSRLTTLAEKDEIKTIVNRQLTIDNRTKELFNSYKFNLILELIWKEIKALNKAIDDFAPWKKTSINRSEFLTSAIKEIHQIGYELQPFIPETSEKILKVTKGKIKKIIPLFPRLSHSSSQI
ncbi:MAG: Methionine-tRNA ligase [Candidatus Roizmanbacteria bacterium GW2011_GWA2_35_19]|uniref:Methionine--tRNA ligase n=2 Tax=Candidatus Roizmaniibacteriota TaxID=1752723 RepID=A0A0G0BYT5_9BACT|nr:MAG: Methionine-tRNA ligase [Candidatus Roizmanbacteria bacterium GW2011_GWC2_35_12]KKP74494.1 MAG: Methionine-tRNA ligase [Candidatus Roizmanbacteria bacterium GW2011_GWA2_35_19]